MKTLQDTTDLLGQTTDQLRGNTAQLTPEAGIALIDQWLEPLQTVQDTKPVAEMLTQLKTLLQTQPVNNEAVHMRLGQLAELTAALAATVGGDTGPAVNALADALRQAGDAVKANA